MANARRRQDNAKRAEGVRVAEVGDVYATTVSKGCGIAGIPDVAGTRANVTGQRVLGSNGEAYSHVMIEVPPKPDGTRQVYESNPGDGPKVNAFQESVDAHGKACQEVHRYAPNVPLTEEQKESLNRNIEFADQENRGYNYAFGINRGKGGPEHCAQAVQNIQNNSKIPPFVQEKYGVIAPLPSDLSVSPNYHRVPSDMTYQGKSTDIAPKPTWSLEHRIGREFMDWTKHPRY